MKCAALLLFALACTPSSAPSGKDPGAVDGEDHADHDGSGSGTGDAGDGGDEGTGTGAEGSGTGDDGGTGTGTATGGGTGGTGGDAWSVDAVVIAGDSWSTGSVQPTEALFAAEGLSIAVTYQETAVAGSTAAEWVANQDSKLDKLDAALDGTSWGRPEADILLLYLGGNDLNFALNEGLPGWMSREAAMEDLLDDIETDLRAVIAHARSGRPDLHVVIVGYDYFHYEWMTALFGLDLDCEDTLEYNRDLADLEERKLGIARTTDRVHYAHNLGAWTHHLGNPVTVPFTMPLTDYPAGFFDAPSVAPDYSPFPGGARRTDIDPAAIPPEILPGPTPALDDGIHPSAAGWSTLLAWTWDQGLEQLVEDGTWAP